MVVHAAPVTAAPMFGGSGRAGGSGGASAMPPLYQKQRPPAEYLGQLAAYVRRNENALLQATIKFTIDSDGYEVLRVSAWMLARALPPWGRWRAMEPETDLC